MIGESIREARKNTDYFNNQVMREQLSPNQSFTSKFPLTTNQDYHNDEVFDKARNINMSKKNYKKKTVYNAYVNATFNAGVFTSPLMDQC